MNQIITVGDLRKALESYDDKAYVLLMINDRSFTHISDVSSDGNDPTAIISGRIRD